MQVVSHELQASSWDYTTRRCQASQNELPPRWTDLPCHHILLLLSRGNGVRCLRLTPEEAAWFAWVLPSEGCVWVKVPHTITYPSYSHQLQKGFQLPASKTQPFSTCKTLQQKHSMCQTLPTNHTLTLGFAVPSDPKHYSRHHQSKALSKKRLSVCRREGFPDST